jgi:hypothetical protein
MHHELSMHGGLSVIFGKSHLLIFLVTLGAGSFLAEGMEKTARPCSSYVTAWLLAKTNGFMLVWGPAAGTQVIA